MGSVVGSDGGESRRRRIRLLRVVREGQERTRGTLESTEGWLVALPKPVTIVHFRQGVGMWITDEGHTCLGHR